jgi:exodeoxyribonuclease VII large subunit
VAKVEPIEYGDRKVFTVAAFNRGIAEWLGRLPTVWVEGEVTELRRQARWQSVFFTLKDPAAGACLAVTMPRGQFDALRLDLTDGERVHVFGRPELYEARGDLRFRALSVERFGLGAHLAAIERLRKQLAAEGLFAPERKRPLPRFPRRIGLVTGNDAAAKRDVLASIEARFPPARILVAETYVQGPRAAPAVVDALRRLCAEPGVDVIVLARGGGSFEDLLPFSDERLVRAVAACPVPVVSAVGHEQDTPLCDLAADVRASTPTAAARLVVPDLAELRAALLRSRAALERGARRTLERRRERLLHQRERLRAAPRLLVERRRGRLEIGSARLRALSPLATLARGYAIVRSEGGLVRSFTEVEPGARVDVTLAEGGLGARVEDVHE